MKTRELIQEALFVALIAIGAFIRIPLAWMDYCTLGMLFVLWAGYLLGAKRGLRAVAVYTALGLAGVPVFVEGGGLAYIFKPTFGYLLGYMACAYWAGYAQHRFHPRTIKQYFLITMAGIWIVYFFGIGYKYWLMNYYFNQVLPLWAIMSASLIPMPAEVTLFGLASGLMIPRLRKQLQS